jgi:hypothetical protein
LCDVVVPVLGRQHVPGTAPDPYLCTDKAAQVGLTALNNFDNSDLSNQVYADSVATAQTIAGIPRWVQRSSPTELLSNPTAFWQQTAQNAQAAFYLMNPALSGAAQGQVWGQDIQCGHYGKVAGDLLFLAGSSYGIGKLGELAGAATRAPFLSITSGTADVFPGTSTEMDNIMGSIGVRSGNAVDKTTWEFGNGLGRVRYESGHPLEPGETYNPRHHGPHFHVELRPSTNIGWSNKAVIKVYPDGYTAGSGTGFMPGERFPLPMP